MFYEGVIHAYLPWPHLTQQQPNAASVAHKGPQPGYQNKPALATVPDFQDMHWLLLNMIPTKTTFLQS